MATAKKTAKKVPASTRITKAATTKTSATKTSATKTSTAKKSDAGLTLGSLDVKAVVTDSAYATLGAGDYAVEIARVLPQRLETARKQRAEKTAELVKVAPAKAQTFVKEAPAKLQAELNSSFETVRKEFDSYATRGRKVVKSITQAPATKRAMSQTDNARSQVKGAVTSIRKAVELGQNAIEGATGRIGNRRSA
ncbi:MAG: hypothetical protein ACR2HR_10895 [Euzebya sp.]